jgi:WD40 repeat protein
MKKKISKEKNKNKLNLLDNIKTISYHDSINSIAIFPSGNIASVSNDSTIIIYDNNFIEIQTIINAHLNSIIYISIKDDNNFVTCSIDNRIIVWIRNNINKFESFQILKNIHSKWINQVIYSDNKNEKIISCSRDQTVKIFEKKYNSNFQCIISLKHTQNIFCVLDVNKKNIIISSGYDGTYFWDKIEYKLMKKINVSCYTNYSLSKIDDDKIIISGNIGLINIIRISDMKLIQTFNNNTWCYCLLYLKEKDLFICGGIKELKVYLFDNLNNIKIIQNAHDDRINGLVKYKNNYIISFSIDGTIKLWKIF